MQRVVLARLTVLVGIYKCTAAVLTNIPHKPTDNEDANQYVPTSVESDPCPKSQEEKQALSSARAI
jgi:hypothetical protein